MESPRYEFIEQRLSYTRVLLAKIEESMRSQLEKQHFSYIPSTNNHFCSTENHYTSDIATTKRGKFNQKCYKKDFELDHDLATLRQRLNDTDLEKKEFFDSFERENLRTNFSQKIENLDENIPCKDTKKFEEIFENNNLKTEKFQNFNEMKYGVEIRLLRDELEKVKKNKKKLEGELKNLKKLAKSKTPSKKSKRKE